MRTVFAKSAICGLIKKTQMKGMSTFVPQDEDSKFFEKPYFYT